MMDCVGQLLARCEKNQLKLVTFVIMIYFYRAHSLCSIPVSNLCRITAGVLCCYIMLNLRQIILYYTRRLSGYKPKLVTSSSIVDGDES